MTRSLVRNSNSVGSKINLKNDPNATQDARKVLQEARIFASERKLVPVVVGGAPAIGVPVICEEEHLVSRLVIWHLKLI